MPKKSKPAPVKSAKAAPAQKSAPPKPAQIAEEGFGVEKWSGEKLERMLSREASDKIRVNDAMAGLEHPFTSLILIDAKEYSQIKNVVMEKFESGYKIIYIAFNSGGPAILKEFEKRRNELKNMFFIDMVSVESGAQTENSLNCTYMKSPLDLTECAIAVDKKLSEIKGAKSMVMLDSVSTLLIYEDAHVVEKFIHSLLGKVNAYAASAAIFSSGTGEHDAVTGTIGQFFEKIIRI